MVVGVQIAGEEGAVVQAASETKQVDDEGRGVENRAQEQLAREKRKNMHF